MPIAARRSATFHAPGRTVTSEASADKENAAIATGGVRTSVASGMKIRAEPKPAKP